MYNVLTTISARNNFLVKISHSMTYILKYYIAYDKHNLNQNSNISIKI